MAALNVGFLWLRCCAAAVTTALTRSIGPMQSTTTIVYILSLPQRIHHNHSFSGWAGLQGPHTAQQPSPCCSKSSATAVQGTAGCFQLQRSSSGGTSEGESCYSSESDNTKQQQQPSGAGASDDSMVEAQDRDRRTGRRLNAARALSSCAAAAAGQTVADDSRRGEGYLGSSRLTTRTSLRRCANEMGIMHQACGAHLLRVVAMPLCAVRSWLDLLAQQTVLVSAWPLYCVNVALC